MHIWNLPAVLPAVLLCLVAAEPAAAQRARFALQADDGAAIANHRVGPELEAQIARLPGIVRVGNPRGRIALYEFYDLNCPYCRRASADLAELVRTEKDVTLVLVPFPVLGIQSIQGSRVELAVAELGKPEQFYDFHRRIFAGRGVVDGNRALAVARELGFDQARLIAAADDDAIGEIMKAHVRLGDALGLAATPSYVIAGVAIVGHPGLQSLRRIVASVRRCGQVAC
jgi:protein-disulfide isomerase